VSQPAFETDRLWVRAMGADDAADLHVARGDPDAMRWWYAGASPSIEETRREIEDMSTWGTQWVFGRHGDGTVLGLAGFHGLGPGEGCGFGYLLRRTEWGAGLVVEASTALLRHGFEDVGIAHAELWIDPGNAQSIRVAEKLGAAHRGWAYTGGLTRIHGITREEWLGAPPRPGVLNVVPVVFVSDVARAMSMWSDGFGFRAGFHVDEPPRMGQVLARWTGGPAVRLIRAPGRPGTSVSMQVGDDVDGLVASAVAAGWRVVEPPEDQPWGTRDATLADPDGNRVSLAGACLSEFPQD
jgi:RimJ/RimL family protein N-acetyltransferase/predicted enzyme related to lactoylglutathione lyase